ncbi:hypothetical protein QZH41_000056 [Actinostola sp. cb2023]|nr:hypothetical protein QZH41_000056 [Actinostola sp. cb2023]
MRKKIDERSEQSVQFLDRIERRLAETAESEARPTAVSKRPPSSKATESSRFLPHVEEDSDNNTAVIERVMAQVLHEKRWSGKVPMVKSYNARHQIDPTNIKSAPQELKLGEGRFGLCEKKLFRGKIVAVKYFKASAVTAQMVEKEAKMINSFDHPGVPIAYEKTVGPNAIRGNHSGFNQDGGPFARR